jgi:hypothetical protein
MMGMGPFEAPGTWRRKSLARDLSSIPDGGHLWIGHEEEFQRTKGGWSVYQPHWEAKMEIPDKASLIARSA